MKLIATAPAFYLGHRIRVGQEFEFRGKRAPKWAAPPAEGRAAIKAARSLAAGQAADTKPIDAQEVVEAKLKGVEEHPGSSVA